MNLVNARERGRFLKFMVVGVIGAVVDFGTFNLLNEVIGVQPVIAQMISFAAAVTSNFLWNRFWTYPDSRSKRVWSQVVQFAIVSIVGLAIRTPLFALLEKPLIDLFDRSLPSLPLVTSEFLGHNAALAFSVLTVMLWNFFVNRYWTYNDVE